MTEPTPGKSAEPSALQPHPGVTPYELAPESAPAAPSPKPTLDAAPFLDGFDDDTDFSDEANAPGRRAATTRTEAVIPAGQRIEPFVLSGRGEPAIIAAVGGGVTVGAMIAVAMIEPVGKFPLAVNAGLQVILQTFTGVIALGVASHLAGRPLGSVVLGFSRMLLAVASFVLLVSINIPLPGRFDEAVLAFCAYGGVLVFTGRRPVREWFPVVASHAILAVLLWAAFALHAWARVASHATPAP